MTGCQAAVGTRALVMWSAVIWSSAASAAVSSGGGRWAGRVPFAPAAGNQTGNVKRPASRS